MRFVLASLVVLAMHCNPVHADNRTPVEPRAAVEFIVQGDYLPTRAKAVESAFDECENRLVQYLNEIGITLPAPLDRRWIERNLVVEIQEEAKQFEELNDSTLLRATLKLRIGDEHLRYFRQADRIRWVGFVGGLLLASFILIAVYYRLDEWTRGYLTKWLALAGVMALALFGLVWWWFHW